MKLFKPGIASTIYNMVISAMLVYVSQPALLTNKFQIIIMWCMLVTMYSVVEILLIVKNPKT